MSDITRKLASVRRIDAILPIEGADKIVLAKIGGWQVVTAIENGFSIGDLVAYCEVDSWIPTELAPFLSKGKEPREYNGVKGERLRSIKLKGQLSQGLILPIAVTEGLADDGTPRWLLSIGNQLIDTDNFADGKDMTDLLGIQKWEKPIPAQLQGQMRGNFPSFLRKTDQERVQNLPGIFNDNNLASLYEATVKLDGSSMTIWLKDGEWGVCSRNIDLKIDQEGNTFVDVAKRIMASDPMQNLLLLGVNIAFQGELMGEGIQGNRENLSEHEFFLFDIWDIDEQRYLNAFTRMSMAIELGLTIVPFLAITRLSMFGSTMDEILAIADMQQSMHHRVAEGIVFKRIDGEFSFKAISNRFLLSEK